MCGGKSFLSLRPLFIILLLFSPNPVCQTFLLLITRCLSYLTYPPRRQSLSSAPQASYISASPPSTIPDATVNFREPAFSPRAPAKMSVHVP